MRRVALLCFLLTFVALSSIHANTAERSGDPAKDFERANALYEEERYAEALTMYEQLMGAGVVSAQVLANAGNAAYKANDTGRAVLYYLRALRLDPRNDMARQNLALIEPRTNAGSSDDLYGVLRLWLLTIPTWLWIVIAEIAFLGALALLLYGIWRARLIEEMVPWGIRAGGLLLIALLAAVGGALSATTDSSDGEAVVIADGSVTRLGPGERYLEQLSLPAGTLVELPDPPDQGWVRCRLKDGRTGFIRTESLERI